MAFENLTDRLSRSFKNLVGQGKLTETNMREMIQEVRFALIEADVHPEVVSDFVDNIQTKALGQEVMTSLKPSEQVVKIVNDELIELLGETQEDLNFKSDPSVIMMVGLQGSGKTTSSAKIAKYITAKSNRTVLLVAADMQRLAAVEQLTILANQVNVQIYSQDQGQPTEVVKNAMHYAKTNGFDTVIVDTAGRLSIDEALMQELVAIESIVKPDEILLTVDAMVGQDIVSVSRQFKQRVSLTGLVVTKYDGDSRGGGILSVRRVTDVPVKFVGTGEKLDDLELFYPDRVASRILGMGDILSLIEQAEAKMDQEASEKAAQRFMDGTFTMDDLLTSLQQVNRMGPLSGLLKLLPGGNKMTEGLDDEKSAESLKKTRAMIQSMTKKEREKPSLIRASQKRRIAEGAGVTTTDVNRLLNQYDKMKDSMRIFSRMMK